MERQPLIQDLNLHFLEDSPLHVIPNRTTDVLHDLLGGAIVFSGQESRAKIDDEVFACDIRPGRDGHIRRQRLLHPV